ncbi:MAG: hypothetical protein KKA67_03295 [Spirochaetes bacterium]|nr:hypothetical protein [Spirochaetota bacterium]MBU1081982.1 hypothetical protein [Spirochaetota bacterium]
MRGMMGKVLIVDLGSGTMEEKPVSAEIYGAYLGGVGLAARLLTDMIPAGADPLGPDNVLAFMSGLLTGTGSMMTGRWTVCCKSPLTGGWGDANCGGTLSPEIKRCGWDGILFRGVSPTPVAFAADENGPRLVDASASWGLDAVEAEDRVKAAWTGKKKPAVAAIGPAAEKLSLISGISNDGGRYAARSGVGAVMGSKRLKSIALAGSRPIPCADPARVKEISKAFAQKVAKINLPGIMTGAFMPLMGRMLGMKTVVPIDGILASAILKKWGTIYNNTAGIVNGDSPVRNWGGSVKDFGPAKYRRLNPDRIRERETRKYHCYSCVVGCGGVCDATGTGAKGEHMHKPEYETCCAFGALALSDDLDSIFLCNDICNRSGLDTISAGSVVAFAFECYERGILTAADTGGLELRWGDGKGVAALLAMIAERRGIGDVLADGVALAAKRIGKGSDEIAVHAGGQEPGMHDGRMDPMMAVAFAADPTPGRHTISAGVYYNVSHLWEFVSWAPPVTRPYAKAREYLPSEEEALKSVAGACVKQLLDATGSCLFALTIGLQHWRLFDWLNAATGEGRSPDEWMEAGRRIQTARAAFGAREKAADAGSDRARDYRLANPRIYGLPPLERGPLAGKTVPLEAMVGLYRKEFGWDEKSGAPSRSTMERLGV